MQFIGCLRIFNEEYDQGGRFYGSIHQKLPKAIRNTIQIDEEETVELDYSGLHFRMLYHREKIDYREDPYHISGIPRDLFKQPSLLMINAKDRLSQSEQSVSFCGHIKKGRNYLKKDKNDRNANTPYYCLLFSNFDLHA